MDERDYKAMNAEIKNQTAVEWLKIQIKNCPNAENSMNNIDGFLKQALEMEKQQIIDAQLSGQRADIEFAHEAKEEAEIYYQETFKK
jgi:hypothetical protein